MSDKNNKNNNISDIDELLRDFGRQKDAHRESFGEIEPPQRSKRQMATGGASSKSTISKQSGKAGKKIDASEKKLGKKTGNGFKAPAKVSLGKLSQRFKSIGKRTKVILLSCIAVLLAIAIAATVAGTAKTAYLRQYKKEYPNVEFPSGIRKGFCEQYAQQSTTVGKLSIGGCEYSGWVLSSKSIGNAQLDKKCTPNAETPDWVTTIYLPGTANLEKAFSDSDAYIKADQSVVYSTLYDDFKYNIIGAFYVNSDAKDDGGYVFPYSTVDKMTGTSFSQFADQLAHRFLYNTDYQLKYGKDRLIMLVGCSSVYPDFKFVAVGVLNGKAQVNAKPNDKIQFPQAWYDIKNQSNPYRYSIGWYPKVYTDVKEKESAVLSAKDY